MPAAREDTDLPREKSAFFRATADNPQPVVPSPRIPDHLKAGVFAHSVRTFTEGGIRVIDFSYGAPIDWELGKEAMMENIVTARVLMPDYDFVTWIKKAALALGMKEGNQ